MYPESTMFLFGMFPIDNKSSICCKKKPEYFKNYLFYVWQQVVPTPTPGIAGEPELILDPPEVIWCQIDRMLVSWLIYVYMKPDLFLAWSGCEFGMYAKIHVGYDFFFSFSLTTLHTILVYNLFFFLVHLA